MSYDNLSSVSQKRGGSLSFYMKLGCCIFIGTNVVAQPQENV